MSNRPLFIDRKIYSFCVRTKNTMWQLLWIRNVTSHRRKYTENNIYAEAYVSKRKSLFFHTHWHQTPSQCKTEEELTWELCSQWRQWNLTESCCSRWQHSTVWLIACPEGNVTGGGNREEQTQKYDASPYRIKRHACVNWQCEGNVWSRFFIEQFNTK